MLFNSPLSSARADRLIELLSLDSSSRVIDVGCGAGEFLRRIADRHGCACVGVDPIGDFPDSTLRAEFHAAKIQDFEAAPESFDCAICLGATHAFSLGEPAYLEALRGLSRLVRPGGQLLIGEGHWTREPDPEYLEFLGEPGLYRTHAENVSFAEEFGLIPLYACASNLDEWDDFEWSHHIEKEKSDSAEVIERSRVWRRNYLKWGRGVMGFGFYLFKIP